MVLSLQVVSGCDAGAGGAAGRGAHDSGLNHPERIRGWYNLAGGGAGFLLVETENPNDLTEFLQPYMDLISWDVHAVQPLDYEQQIERLRHVTQ